MNRVPVDIGDCERVGTGALGQPVNALSSLAYLAAGVSLAGVARTVDAAARRRRLLCFALAVAGNGVGGIAYHGLGGGAGRWLHDTAILSTLGLLVATDVDHLASRPPGGASARGELAVAVGAALLAVVPAVSTPAQATVAAGVVCTEALRARAGGRRALAWPALVLVAAAAVHRLSATGGPLCRPDSLLQGHAVWHGLTAWVLWRWGREEARPMVSDPRALR